MDNRITTLINQYVDIATKNRLTITARDIGRLWDDWDYRIVLSIKHNIKVGIENFGPGINRPEFNYYRRLLRFSKHLISLCAERHGLKILPKRYKQQTIERLVVLLGQNQIN